MPHQRLIAALAALAAFAQPALAQERPRLQPTSDVEVAYKTLGRDAGHTMTISQSASIPRMRIDGGNMPGYAIVDRTRHTTTVVMDQQRSYMEISGDRPGGSPTKMPDERSSFRRTGSDTIAGLTCTVWEVSTDGQGSAACVTANGVMLRIIGKDGRGLEATKVTYVTQPASKFAPPADYQQMQMPAGMGSMQGFTLPPGIKLPPGMQLPPGMTLPPSR